MKADLKDLDASDVSFLPIVAAYGRELGVVDEINRLCGRSKAVEAGKVCLALILDTLTGRSPLFRLEDSFAHLDIELLLGEGIGVSQLNDDAVGRVLDRLYEVGTNKILSAVAMRYLKTDPKKCETRVTGKLVPTIGFAIFLVFRFVGGRRLLQQLIHLGLIRKGTVKKIGVCLCRTLIGTITAKDHQ